MIIDIGDVTRLVAVRDEDPAREWDELGTWWPDQPTVSGVRDRRAGGAWLAFDAETRRLAVLLNRADQIDLPESELRSRGGIVLDSVAGRFSGSSPRTHGFNLVEVTVEGAQVTTWDGESLRVETLQPGTHMVAHDGVDDPSTARIAAWLPRFRGRSRDPWPQAWLDLLGSSAGLPVTDDRAIIRDNRVHGYPTQSLLYCTAQVSADGVNAQYTELPGPAQWTDRAS